MSEQNKALVRRYYDQLWNKWDLGVADEIIASDIAFRGSLAMTVEGRDGFRRYVNIVRAAFPDFHNTLEDLIAEGDKVVARLTYRGTHRGEMFGLAPTGRQVVYTGVAVFRISDGQVVDGWVMGDMLGLMQQLGVIPMPG